MRRDLIRKPDQPAGVFMTEVGSPDGHRRADALYIPAVGGTGIIGHEIKVSRSDVLAELADPHKAEAWKKYCIRWWLVVADAKLVDGLEIPDDWGVKTPPTQQNRRQFTVIKPAPKLDPHPLGPALSRIATVWAYRQRDAEWAKRQNDTHTARLNTRIAELEDKLRRAGVHVTPPPPDQERAMQLMAALRKRDRYARIDSRLDIETLADAVLEATAAANLRAKVADAARDKLTNIDRALADFRKSWQFSDLHRLLEETKTA